MYTIFIVEDDIKIAQLLRNKMEQYGYKAVVATSFKHILEQFVEVSPHLVLLDINLPFYDGYYWCRQIRKSHHSPIIFISAREGEMDQVLAIENGGDDYITKPVQLELLMAKVRGQLRRAYGEYAPNQLNAAVRAEADDEQSGYSNKENEQLNVHDIVLWLARNEISYGNITVELTKNELLLAQCLLVHYGEVVTRNELLEALWDDVHFVDDNTLTVNITRLRKKFSELNMHHTIETIRGQGYRLKLNAE